MLGLSFSPLDPMEQQEDFAAPHATAFSQSPVSAQPCDLRLTVTIPQLGVFYVFIDARDTISTLLLLIERKVLEIYRTNIVVKKVQDEFGIDLPPSYSIGSMLANNATVTVDHALCAPLPQKVLTGNWMRNQLLQSSSGPLSPAKTLHNNSVFPTPASTIQHNSNNNQDTPSTPSPDIIFSVQPPTKVVQNKEFVCTIKVPPTVAVTWTGDLPISLSVCDGRGREISHKDYTIRHLVLNEVEGEVLLIVRIRKNSYYGRDLYALQVNCPGPVGAFSALSEKIHVLAKRKTRPKKGHAEYLVYRLSSIRRSA